MVGYSIPYIQDPGRTYLGTVVAPWLPVPRGSAVGAKPVHMCMAPGEQRFPILLVCHGASRTMHRKGVISLIFFYYSGTYM